MTIVVRLGQIGLQQMGGPPIKRKGFTNFTTTGLKPKKEKEYISMAYVRGTLESILRVCGNIILR